MGDVKLEISDGDAIYWGNSECEDGPGKREEDKDYVGRVELQYV